MTGTTHGAWGMAAGAGMACLSSRFLDTLGMDAVFLHALGILIGGLAALLPDLDSEESLIQTLPAREGRRTGSLLLALLGALLSGVLRLISAVVRLFTGHREATHRVWALLVGSAASGLLAWAVATAVPLTQAHRAVTVSLIASIAGSRDALLQAAYMAVVVAIGWGSHLLLDALTPEGIYPFRPWWDIRVRILRVRTGSPGDSVLGIIGGSLAGVLVVLYCVTFLGNWSLDGLTR